MTLISFLLGCLLLAFLFLIATIIAFGPATSGRSKYAPPKHKPPPPPPPPARRA